jgi:hypothetical protein
MLREPIPRWRQIEYIICEVPRPRCCGILSEAVKTGKATLLWQYQHPLRFFAILQISMDMGDSAAEFPVLAVLKGFFAETVNRLKLLIGIC